MRWVNYAIGINMTPLILRQHPIGIVESILQTAGFRLTRVADAYLCYDSADTYSQ